MSDFDWFWELEAQAYEQNDGERMRMFSLYRQSLRVGHNSPREKLVVLTTARDLARQLGESWCEMVFEHWIINALLYGTVEPHHALDHAVRAVFEISKPHFTGFSERFDLQMNLAQSYMGVDPIGYERELRALFVYLQAGCGADPNRRAFYLQEWGYFLELVEDENALDAAFHYLQSADQGDSTHSLMVACKMVCIASMRFNRDAARQFLAEIAAAGEEAARHEQYNLFLAEFLMWRAVAARWEGKEVEAKRFYRQALQVQAKLPAPQNAALYAAVAWHEAGGEILKALQICQNDIRILHRHQLFFLEVQRRVDKCRLLKQLGRDFSREAKRLRRVAATLKSQAHWEKKLRELEEAPKENH